MFTLLLYPEACDNKTSSLASRLSRFLDARSSASDFYQIDQFLNWNAIEAEKQVAFKWDSVSAPSYPRHSLSKMAVHNKWYGRSDYEVEDWSTTS